MVATPACPTTAERTEERGNAAMTQLSVPELEVLGTTYVVRWSEGVTLRCERLYEHRDHHVDAEITITDETELAPHLMGPIRTSITKTWRSIVSDLDGLSERRDWRQRLTQATILVLERYRAGTPVVALGAMEPPEPTREMLSGILWQHLPTLVYGPGGIGKSAMCLAWASALHTGTQVAGLQTTQSNTLYLDWETSDRLTYWRNKELLDGAGVDAGPWPDPDYPDAGRTGMVYYRFMSGPLWDDVEYLKGEIARLGIGTVCIDSAGPACGGEPESASSTLRFFTGLRDMSDPDKPLQSIILAHVTHAAQRGGRSSPFGSVYWINIPRNVFELQSAPSGANHSDYALHHRKSNVGSLREPLGFRLTWGEGCSVEEFDIKKSAQLAAGLPHGERVHMIIEESGPMSTDDLAELLDVPTRTLASTLSRDERFSSVNGKWTPSERDW